MSNKLAEWDAKHRAAKGEVPEPASLVVELLPVLPRGAALDIACGRGRHALLLASRGWQVTAIDGSSAALQQLAESARKQGIAVQQDPQSPPQASGVTCLRADLEQAQLARESFDVILCVNYLERRLFEQFVQALRPGGMLLMETFTIAQPELSAGPHNPAYLLRRGELRMAFPTLRTLFSRELAAGQGIASLLAQKPAGERL
jgi:tellurite methyltransferase